MVIIRGFERKVMSGAVEGVKIGFIIEATSGNNDDETGVDGVTTYNMGA